MLVARILLDSSAGSLFYGCSCKADSVLTNLTYIAVFEGRYIVDITPGFLQLIWGYINLIKLSLLLPVRFYL
jgi:hypothetical protein